MKRISQLQGYIFKASLFFVFTFSFLNLAAQTTNAEGAITREIKCSDGPDKDIKVTITINPAKIPNLEKGYQRLIEIIPEGFSAKADPSTTATSDIKNNKLKFYWMNGSLPAEGTIQVSYCLHKTTTEKIKSIVIEGSFTYSENNDSNEILISGDNTCKL